MKVRTGGREGGREIFFYCIVQGCRNNISSRTCDEVEKMKKKKKNRNTD